MRSIGGKMEKIVKHLSHEIGARMANVGELEKGCAVGTQDEIEEEIRETGIEIEVLRDVRELVEQVAAGRTLLHETHSEAKEREGDEVRTLLGDVLEISRNLKESKINFGQAVAQVWHKPKEITTDSPLVRFDFQAMAVRAMTWPVPPGMASELCMVEPKDGRTGTNLMNVAQAENFLRYVLGGFFPAQDGEIGFFFADECKMDLSKEPSAKKQAG